MTLAVRPKIIRIALRCYFVLRHKQNAWQRLLLNYGGQDWRKMEPPKDNTPGVKEAAQTYLAAKQIPQLFQVVEFLSDPRNLTMTMI